MERSLSKVGLPLPHDLDSPHGLVAGNAHTRELYQSIGNPSLNDYKSIINIDAIHFFPFTLQDIELAEQVFGPDIRNLKFKSIRKKKSPVFNDYIEVTNEIKLCAGIMYIKGITFLVTASKKIRYLTIEYIKNRSASSSNS